MKCEIGIAGWLYSQEIMREQSMTLLQMPAACAAHGVTVVELCSSFFPNQQTDYLNELRSALQDSALSVWSIAVDMGNIAGDDAVVRRTDIEGLKQWFYTASALGSKAIRINTGHADDPEAANRAVEAYRDLAETGRQAGVRLLIENHGGLSARSDGLATIIDGVGTEWFGTCPDTGNFYGADWEDGMRVMAPRAYSCHLKLAHLEPDSMQVWTDQNGDERECNLKVALSILKESGYSGPICLEREAVSAGLSKAENIRNSVEFIRNLLEAS
jgi:sugar phosphate isomerase/epimerase